MTRNGNIRWNGECSVLSNQIRRIVESSVPGRVPLYVGVFLLSAGMVCAQGSGKGDAQREATKQQILQQIEAGKDINGSLWKLYAGRYDETYPMFYGVFRDATDPRIKATALELMKRRGMPNLDKAVIEAINHTNAQLTVKGLDFLSAAKDNHFPIRMIQHPLLQIFFKFRILCKLFLLTT